MIHKYICELFMIFERKKGKQKKKKSPREKINSVGVFSFLFRKDFEVLRIRESIIKSMVRYIGQAS